MNQQVNEQAQHIQKVVFKKQISTKVYCDDRLYPNWIDDTHVCYCSAYEFINYNIDDESTSILARPQNQSKILAATFSKQFNYTGIEVIYAIKQDNYFYLCMVPSIHPFKKMIGEKYMQSDISEIHAIHKLQGNTIIIIATIRNKRSLMLTNLSMKCNQIVTRETSIIKVLQTKIPGYICIQTQKQLILAKVESESMSIKFLSTFQVSNRAIISLVTDFVSNYALIFQKQQVIIVPFDMKKFLKPSINFIDIEQIGGVHTNLRGIIVWEKNIPVMHHFELDDQRISFKNRIQFQLRNSKIDKIIFSDKNRNVLIVSKHNNLLSDIFIFKLDLYSQLSHSQPEVFMRPLKYVYKEKKVHEMSVAQVGSNLYALTGLTIHNLNTSLLDGILSFDVHPLGLYLVVSFGFSAKVYSLQNSNISLIFSCSMQNIKKVKYSKSGADLVLFSNRQIRIVDAYSFMLKHQINEKMNNFIDLSFGYCGQFLYALTESGMVYCYNSYDYRKVDSSRNLSTQKITQIKVDQKTQRQCLLTEKGTIIFRNRISNLKIYEYQINQRVTAFQIDCKNGIIFIGTQSGNLRSHLWPMQSVQARNVDQIRISFSEITCIELNSRKKTIYIGSNCGNISCLKYKVRASEANCVIAQQGQHSDKILGLQRYILSSNVQNGNSQENILQSKLEEIINKISDEMKNFKGEFKESFEKKKEKLAIQTDNHIVYAANKQRVHAIQRQLNNVEQIFQKQKLQMQNSYQKQIKRIAQQQEALSARKFLLISLHHMTKKSIRNKNQQNQNQLQRQCQEAADFKRKMVERANIQRNLPFITHQVIPQVQNATYRQLNESLQEQLKQQKQRCCELRKQFIYLKTAKANITDRKIKQETLQHKITQQIRGMSKTKDFHTRNASDIKKQLSQTQRVIQKMQNKVKPGKQKKKSDSKSKTDICSYKVYMKNKVTGQLDMLRDHLVELQQQLEVKWLDLVAQITLKKNNNAKISQLKQDLEKLKQVQKQLRNSKLNISYRLNNSPMAKTCTNSFQSSPLSSVLSIEKANKGKDLFTEMIQKSNHFLNNSIKVGKRKMYKLSKQNTTLLNQYLRLKYQNKQYIDKQNQLLDKMSKVQQNMNNSVQTIDLKISKTARNLCATQTPFTKYIKDKNIKSHRSVRFTPKASPISTPVSHFLRS